MVWNAFGTTARYPNTATAYRIGTCEPATSESREGESSAGGTCHRLPSENFVRLWDEAKAGFLFCFPYLKLSVKVKADFSLLGGEYGPERSQHELEKTCVLSAAANSYAS
jgi:hypothetical protein